MKASSFRVVFVLMAVFLLNLAPRAWAAAELNDDLTESEKAGIGCAAMTGIAFLGSFAAGPGELIMIAGGGSLAPSATAPLMISLTATVYVAACGMGIAAMPAVLWFTEQVGVFFDGVWGKASPALDTNQKAKGILAANNERSDRMSADSFVVPSSQ
jgi:hypothetical protein